MSKAKPPKLLKDRPPRGFSGNQAEFEREALDRDQFKAFRDAARELECDDDEKSFDKVLKKIVKAPPPASVQKRKK